MPKFMRGENFILFIIAAGLSAVVNLISRFFISFFFGYSLAIVLAHLIGMLTAFTLMRFFVFQSSGKRMQNEIRMFVFVNILSMSQTWLVAVIFVYYVFPIFNVQYHMELLGHFIGLASTAVTSFMLHKNFTFKR